MTAAMAESREATIQGLWKVVRILVAGMSLLWVNAMVAMLLPRLKYDGSL
jgi:hypothetical protein